MKKLLAIAVMFGALTANAQEEKKKSLKKDGKGVVTSLFYSISPLLITG